jgi:putative peptidoglycan binding protein
MSRTDAPEQAAGAALSPSAGGRHRAGRRRWVAAGAVVVVAGAAAAVAITDPFASSRAPGLAGAAYPTSTATVTRRSLSSQDQVNATLGYAGSHKVAGQGGGTITWLPAAGQVIGLGRVLYRVDNGTPVFLLYGAVPAWRALWEGTSGADVRQLNRGLVALGYATSADLGPASGWDYFSAETAYALEKLQARLGLTVTGTLPLGQAVFLPSAIRVAAVLASLGSSASGPLLQASSTTPVVTINLDAARQTEVKDGDRVTVTLPDGRAMPGVVSSVGVVASGSGSAATIPVEVTLTDPRAARGLDQAPVTVVITTGTVSNALVVPITALLAQAAGYAVEEIGPRGHSLVAVSPGAFDAAAGLVQVTGPGLAAGQRIVVPTP